MLHMRSNARPGRERGPEHSRARTCVSRRSNPRPLGRGGCQSKQAVDPRIFRFWSARLFFDAVACAVDAPLLPKLAWRHWACNLEIGIIGEHGGLPPVLTACRSLLFSCPFGLFMSWRRHGGSNSDFSLDRGAYWPLYDGAFAAYFHFLPAPRLARSAMPWGDWGESNPSTTASQAVGHPLPIGHH